MSKLSNILDITQYHLNPYSIAPLLVAILVLIFVFFLNYLEKKSTFNRSLIYFCIVSTVWLISIVLVLNSKTEGIAEIWMHTLYAGFVFMPVTLYHLSVNLTEKNYSQRNFLILAYIAAVLLIGFCKSPYFCFGVKKYFFGFYPMAGFLQPILLIFFGGCFLFSIVNLITYHFSLYDSLERGRMRLFIFSFIVMSASFIDILATYDLYFYPSGFIGLLGFTVGITLFKLMFYYDTVQKHSENLEHEVERKTKELSKAVDELRTTQFKLIETGKKSALASLSAGILHQISQPITAIHGFARFLKKEMKEKDPFYKPVSLIEEQSVYIKRMLEDLMNLVRHREIKKEHTDVNTIIKRAMDLLTDELRIRRVNWDLHLGLKLPEVYADHVHLQQIFMNMVVNALQSFENLPRGAIRYIKITSQLDEERQEIIVYFEDTGPGLSQDEKKAIAEPFFSMDAKTSVIGLALCQDLIAEHGGRIEVDNTAEGGTTYVLRFPISGSSQPTSAKISTPD